MQVLESGPDESRFVRLWREQHGFLLAYARRRLPALDLAEEAVAEAFARAWAHRDEVPDGPSARTWLTRATFHEVSNLQRRQERQGQLVGRLVRERDPAEPGLWPDALSDAHERVQRALARLSPGDQEVLRLSTWEQFDHPELAEVLGISTNHVAVRLHRARQRLRLHLNAGESVQGSS